MEVMGLVERRNGEAVRPRHPPRLRRDIADQPGKFPADRACTRSALSSARPVRGHQADDLRLCAGQVAEWATVRLR